MVEKYRYFVMTLDPVHIGTGGYRLGRIDNSIVREPGTNLPKIPGTALHGSIRHYSAYRYGKPKCAGQSGHCGQPTCPICYTFGSVSGDRARAGVVRIHDARILLFPVYSMVGPVWVTSPSALYDAGFSQNGQPYAVSEDKALWSDTLTSNNHLNLGWLMVERDDLSPKWNPATIFNGEVPNEIANRVVLISDKLFSQIVNSNLEVRTSVAIDPATGAAEEHALFTYEAIPRATVLWMDVVVDDYGGEFPSKEKWEKMCKRMEENLPDTIPDSETKSENALRQLGYISARPQKRKDETEEDFEKRRKEYWNQVQKALQSCKEALSLNWSNPSDVLALGLDWLEHLGVGGMGTRGFGRVKLICYKKEGNTKANGILKECEKRKS